MPPHRTNTSAIARFFSVLALVAGTYVAATPETQAADHKVSPTAEKFNCSGVKPGDTVTLGSGTRGPLKIYDCNGSASNRIVIRNDPDGSGPLVIRRASGPERGFIFDCRNCIGVEIDGSYKWRGAPSGKTYGIKVTMTGGQGPSAFVRIGGVSRFFTIRNIEVDGAWPKLASDGSGIRVNDQEVNRSSNPGLWREGILIEDNYVHNIRNEGMYIGPNYSTGDIPLRNVEVRYNRVEDIGWEGINTKSMWDGDNSIHHNTVRRTGTNTSEGKSSQFSGINNISGTVKIYNNWIETTGQHGILVWTQGGPRASEGRGPFLAHIWNNVIVGAGALWRSNMGASHGINVGAESGTELPVPNVYSNTIVDARGGAINIGSVSAGLLRDNIAAGTRGNPVIRAPGGVKLVNNWIGSVSAVEFMSAGSRNFRLSASSPARNNGSNEFPPNDYGGVKRPQDGAPDQGAFEGGN